MMRQAGTRQTIMDVLTAAHERGEPAQFPVRPTARVGAKSGIVVAVDNGNDALKLSVFDTAGRLFTLRVPTAYRIAEMIRGGDAPVSYGVNGGAEFWIGEAAIAHNGDALPIGPTRQRMVDLRLRTMIAASLAELLTLAGYAPGTYALIVGFAIPNLEIIPIRGVGESDERLGVDPETRSALETHLKGASWTITRTDASGVVTDWTLSVLGVVPQAQSTGTLHLITKSPSGTTVRADLSEVAIIDVGNGDAQVATIQMHPAYWMTTNRVGDGTIQIARALIKRVQRGKLNDVAAQHALITRTMLISGRLRAIDAEVTEVLNGPGQALIASLLPAIQQNRSFLVFTGGGVLLLHDLIMERLMSESKRPGEDFEVIGSGLASVANAIGVLFSTVWAATATRTGTPAQGGA